MQVSGREVETPEFSIVANTTLKQILAYLVDVGVTNDSFSESKKKRPGDRGTFVADRSKNLVSAA